VDATLVDPPLEPAAGRAALSQLFAVVQSHYPGHTFRRISGIDQHHEFARYHWEMVGPDGGVAINGMDVVEFDGGGRLRKVTGFLGDVPALS
jgi:hypothetical protein